MKESTKIVGFFKIKESRYNELKETGELTPGFYLVMKDDENDGEEEDESENELAFTGSHGKTIKINELIDIKFSMDEFGKRAAELGKSLQQLQDALKLASVREAPSFAPLYQFAQKDEE